VSLIGKQKDARARAKDAKLRAKEAKVRAAVSADRAQQRARDAAAQLTPAARNAQASAAQGVHSARRWAAPRLDRASRAVQESVAPVVADMLSDAARRMEPAPARRRRWPMVAAGISMLAAGASALAYLLTRRENLAAKLIGRGEQPAETAPGETAAAEADGQVRTP
jgi:hypothetical protein